MNDNRALFQFTPEDFASIEDHIQKWRFDVDVLPDVRILNAATGRAVHDVLSRYVSDHDYYALSEHYVIAVEECDASRDDAAVAFWLRRHDTNASQDVLVSHGSRGVYIVTWGLFCEHWSNFCHPASDDVVISPLSESWVLMYYHEEIFFWAKVVQRVS